MSVTAMTSAQAPSPNDDPLTQAVITLAEDHKARELLVIDVRGHCSYADTIVVCSGTSDRHVTAIADAIDRGLGARGFGVLGREGVREGQWALIDTGHTIVHVFHPFTRATYSLETLWQKRPQSRLTDDQGEPTPAPAAAAPTAAPPGPSED